MTIRTTRDALGITRMVASGALTLDAVVATAKDLWRDDDPELPSVYLWDLRGVTAGPTPDEIRELAEFVVQNRGDRGGRVAIVAPTDVVFGFARMYSAYVGRLSVEVGAFRTVPEAETWLLNR